MEHRSALAWSPSGATGAEGARRFVARAAELLGSSVDRDWRGVAAQAFTCQALALQADCATLAAQVEEAAVAVAAVRAELASARAATSAPWPWWAAG